MQTDDATRPATQTATAVAPGLQAKSHATPVQLRTGARSTFWFAFWLAALMAGAKAAYVDPPEFSLDGLLDWSYDWAVMSHADVLFAFGVGLVGQAAVSSAARRPRVELAVWAALLLFCVASVIYAVVSVRVFGYLRAHLTYSLIYLAGDMKNMRSSVGAFVSLPIVTALVGAPAAYLLLSWSSHRLIQPKRTLAFRVGQGLGLVALAAYVLLARQTVAGPWSDRDDRRIADNPHWELISSYAIELLGGRTVRLTEKFSPEDLTDFQIVAERAAGAESALQLTERPKNVIVLVLESVAAQHLSLYGGKYKTTPRLEAEAAHSVVLDNFYCHVGLTANSLVAISLGIYPGMTWREYTREFPEMPGTSLASLLRPRGYRTAFITTGDLAYVNQDRFLQNRGFDDLWDYRQLGAVPPPDFSWGVEDRYLVDGAFQWIERDPTQPFFILAWTQQTHHPYTLPVSDKIDFFQGDLPPDDYDLDLYLNALHEVDRQIGRLFDGLRERGLADDTLVLITGDHGEAFGHPHNTYGHGGKLYDENVRVPFVLWNPKLFGPGRREQTVGSHIDVNPTVLDLLGMSPPNSWQGRSLFDTTRPPRAYFYSANTDYLLGVREQNWKYVYNATLGREELFDVTADPNEQTNRASEQPELCKRLRQRLSAWLDYETRHMARLQAEQEKAGRPPSAVGRR